MKTFTGISLIVIIVLFFACSKADIKKIVESKPQITLIDKSVADAGKAEATFKVARPLAVSEHKIKAKNVSQSQTSTAEMSSLEDKLEIGRIVNGNPVFKIDITKIKEGIKNVLKLRTLTSAAIVFTGNIGYGLDGEGLLESGDKVSYSFQLEVTKDIVYLMGNGCTQTCTSSTGCSGCTLTKISDCGGSCECNTSTIYTNPSTGSCTHTVSGLTSGSMSASQQLLELLH